MGERERIVKMNRQSCGIVGNSDLECRSVANSLVNPGLSTIRMRSGSPEKRNVITKLSLESSHSARSLENLSAKKTFTASRYCLLDRRSPKIIIIQSSIPTGCYVKFTLNPVSM